MDILLTILLLSFFAFWATAFRWLVSDAKTRLLLNCVSAIYFLPPILLANGFEIAETFHWAMHEVDVELLAIKVVFLASLANAFVLIGMTAMEAVTGVERSWSIDWRGIALAKVFTLVCVTALYFYADAIGGFEEMLTTVLLYKAGMGPVDTEFTFLKQLSTVGAVAWLILADSARETGSKRMWLWAWAAFIVGGIGIFIQGGRLSFFLFVAPCYLLMPRFGRWMTIVALPIAAVIMFNPDRLIFGELEGQRDLDYVEIVRSIMSDFFNAVINVYWIPLFDIDTLRYFSDVLMVPTALLPKKLLDLGAYEGEAAAVMEIVGHKNAVDLIGFGMLSLGITGVVIWAFVYGAFLTLMVRVMHALTQRGYRMSAFGLLLFLIFRPMYFSPHHFLFSFLAFVPYLFLVRSTIQPISAFAASPRSSR